MKDQDRCIARVTNTNGWHSYQCTRKKVVGDFCKQHDPEAVQAREDKRNAKWNAEWAEKRKARAHQRAGEAAIELCKDIIGCGGVHPLPEFIKRRARDIFDQYQEDIAKGM